MKTRHTPPKKRATKGHKPRRLAPEPGSRPEVRCGCCTGTGKVILGNDLWRTLQRLDSTPRRTEDLQEKGITRNAINNRLIDLETHGLAVCVGKQGKWRMWCAVNAMDEGRRTSVSETTGSKL